jgi:hypothetical protein
MLHGGTENSSICIELPYQLKSKRGYKKSCKRTDTVGFQIQARIGGVSVAWSMNLTRNQHMMYKILHKYVPSSVHQTSSTVI